MPVSFITPATLTNNNRRRIHHWHGKEDIIEPLRNGGNGMSEPRLNFGRDNPGSAPFTNQWRTNAHGDSSTRDVRMHSWRHKARWLLQIRMSRRRRILVNRRIGSTWYKTGGWVTMCSQEPLEWPSVPTPGGSLEVEGEGLFVLDTNSFLEQ